MHDPVARGDWRGKQSRAVGTWRRARRAIGLASAIVLIWCASPAGAYVMWTNSTGLGRANADGDTPTLIVSNLLGTSAPTGAAVAVDGQHVYWLTANSIARANLDGSAPNLNFIPIAGGPDGVAVDGQHIYWGSNGPTASAPDFIGRANLDGSNVNPTFVSGITGVITGVAVDGQYIYWTNFWASTIGRSNLDGTGVKPSFISATHTPVGIAVDSQHIYWGITYDNAIGRANIDGSQPNVAWLPKNTVNSAANQPIGVAVDAQHIYWANAGNGTIGRASLDGSDIRPGYIAGAGTSPAGVAVNTTPAAVTPPSVTGSAVAGNTLSEVNGIWSHLPTSYAYQWLRCDAAGNGCAPISGATGQAYVPSNADVGSRLRVQEVAVDAFGGASQPALSLPTAVVADIPVPPVPGPKPPVVQPAVLAVLGAVADVARTAAPTAWATVACAGSGGELCQGTAVMSVTEHLRGHLVGAVSARKRPKRGKAPATRTVTVGQAGYSVAAGQQATVPVALNQVGQRLLSRFYALNATLSFPGTAIPPRTVQFRYARITSPILWTALFNGAGSRFASLTVSQLPRGARILVVCRGRGCPFGRVARTATHRTLNLSPLLSKARLAPGSRLRLTISAPAMVAKVVTILVHSGSQPTATMLCQAPGAAAPRACR